MPSIIHKVEIEGSIAWRAEKGERRWVGVCDQLNLAVEADSLDELHNLIPETIHVLLMDLFEDNELEQYLRDRGWRIDGMPGSPTEDVEFLMPWYMNVEGAGDFECRAH